jgi:hypothetical protein
MELDPKDLEDMGLKLDEPGDEPNIVLSWLGIGCAVGIIVFAVFFV